MDQVKLPNGPCDCFPKPDMVRAAKAMDRQQMIFASDNWAGAHPSIAAGLAAQSGGYASAYGSSDLD